MPFTPVTAPVRFLRHTVDTLASLVSGLGTGRDKAATTYYSLPTLSAGELVTMYRASWLARKIVTIPALDATRKWRAWQTDYPTIEAIEKEEKRLDVQRKVLAAKTKARLYGASALYIGTGDLTPAMPLVPERIGKGGVRFLNVMAQSDLNPGDIEANPESPYYGTPAWYELRLRRSISGETVRIHPSRLALFVGEPISGRRKRSRDDDRNSLGDRRQRPDVGLRSNPAGRQRRRQRRIADFRGEGRRDPNSRPHGEPHRTGIREPAA